MSIATVSVRWLCRKLRLVGEGARARRQIPPEGGLADIDAELEQFAVDARCAPEGVGSPHLVDEVMDFGIHLGSSETV
jgi:hypothetical protein